MQTVQILAICGSLRARSSNLSLLQATQKLAPDNWEITFFEGLSELPHFNPDQDTDQPPVAVTDFRDLLRRADGLVICTPEYAHGLPGSLKNALDWTVSSGEWMEKPALVLNASLTAYFAHESLVEILTTIMADVLPHRIGISGNKMDVQAMVENEEIASKLRLAIAELSARIQ